VSGDISPLLLYCNHWSNHAVYWIGPLAGGVIGAWISDLIFLGTPKDEAGLLR
jgi:glycerol uptake facilitator-like aquaporin